MPRLLAIRPEEGLDPLLQALRADGFEVTIAGDYPDLLETRTFDVVLAPSPKPTTSTVDPDDGPVRLVSTGMEADPTGWAACIAGICREHRRRRLLSRILETSPDLEAWIGTGGECEYISPSCEDLTGYQPEAYRADPSLLVRTIHPEDQERVRLSLLDRTVAQSLCCRLVTRSGEVRRIVHRVVPCQDERGEPIGIRVHQQRAPDEDPGQEIQRLRNLLGQTEADRALLSAVIESLPVGVIATGGEGELLVANPAAVPYLEQVRGATLPAEVYIGHYRELERQVRGPDGGPLYLHLSAGPLTRTGHRIFGAVGAIHDVTQVRAAAQARRRELAEATQQLWRLEGENADLAGKVKALEEEVATQRDALARAGGTAMSDVKGPKEAWAEWVTPAILDAMPDQVWILDEELRVLHVNAAGADAVRRRRERVIGEPWTGLGLSSSLEREIERKVTRVFAAQAGQTGVWTDGIEGVPQFFQYSVWPLREGTETTSVVVTIRDGSVMRGFLESTERSTLRLFRLHFILRAILDQMPIGIVIAEVPSGRVLFQNPGFAEIWGEGIPTPSSITEYGTWTGTGPDRVPYTPETWPLARSVRTGERVVNEEAELCPTGGVPRIYSICSGPVHDENGRVYAAVSTFIDVTDRRRAEMAVRASEERLSLAARAIPQVFAIYDRNGRYLFVNGVGLRLLGREEDEVLGRTDAEVFGFSHRPPYCRLLEETVKSLLPQHGEVVISGADDKKHSLSVSCLPLVQQDGVCNEVLLIGHDTTRERSAARALEGYADELKRSNEDLQQFAYVASHDLQEPLRSVISFVQLLERRYRGRLDRDADEIINFITEGGMRMQALINDLLAFSRVSTRAEPFSVFPLGDAVHDALLDLRAAIEESGAVVHCGPMPPVWGDRSQMVQVFVNLINNAIKFARSDVPPEIRISAIAGSGMWHIRVADNGIGIEPEYFERIFVIFQRLHTRDAYPGTGIGLAIVRKIVERHGGRVWLESVPGEGSVFHFTLPDTPPELSGTGTTARREDPILYSEPLTSHPPRSGRERHATLEQVGPDRRKGDEEEINEAHHEEGLVVGKVPGGDHLAGTGELDHRDHVGE